jgi:ribosome-associated protein
MDAARTSERRRAATQALGQSDAALLRECQEAFFVAGGPGGQHRNKTASGVRLLHLPTGLLVTATERRSQAQNRSVALRRLRAALAAAAHVVRPRRPTRPSRGANERRLERKRQNARRKAERKGVP